MKRKMAMMGLTMMVGFPHAICAKGIGKMGVMPGYSSGSATYDPHYGVEGTSHPLMDHFSMAGVLRPREGGQAWHLELVPPAAVYQADDPLMARDKRVGVTFKMEF